jgi:DoxX-like protein
MTQFTESGPLPKNRLWTGRILSGLAVAFLIFDVSIHIMAPAAVVKGFTDLGYSPSLARPLGFLELVCLLLYLIPRTSVLGAVLLTGYLGGAVATNVRVAAPLFSNTLFPVYVALFLWGGLVLRNDRLRTVFPLQQ